MPNVGYSHRPVALGHAGMVASAHPLATLTGVEVLKAGGTAADAAVAVNAVLGVTQPYCCGVGGDLFGLYYDAASERVYFLNGAGRSGSRATLAEAARRGGRAPALGERLRQPDLARTLTDLGAEGPELFYRGRVARAMAACLEADGFLIADDLAAHTGEWGEPIATSYRGVTVYQTPPPTQG